LENEIKRLKRSVSLAESENREVIVRLRNKSNENLSLKDQLVAVSDDLKRWKDALKEEKARIERSIKKQLDESLGEVESLRHLLKHKNRELRSIKKLSQEILDQRNEVEEFFLQSLNHVKKEMVEEKRRNRTQSFHDYNSMQNQFQQQMGSGGKKLPKLTMKQMSVLSSSTPNNESFFSRQKQDNLPSSPTDRVFIQDLSWGDKERVLRVLFAKINNIQREVNESSLHPISQGLSFQESYNQSSSSSSSSSNENHIVFATEGKI